MSDKTIDKTLLRKLKGLIDRATDARTDPNEANSCAMQLARRLREGGLLEAILAAADKKDAPSDAEVIDQGIQEVREHAGACLVCDYLHFAGSIPLPQLLCLALLDGARSGGIMFGLMGNSLCPEHKKLLRQIMQPNSGSPEPTRPERLERGPVGMLDKRKDNG